MGSISGSDKDDTLADTAENDVIDGGAGNDTLTSTKGIDTLIGGGGIDILDARGNPDPGTFATGAYNGIDNLDTGTEADTIYFGNAGGLAWIGLNDTVFGGAGEDTVTINLQGSTAGITLDLTELASGAPIALGTGALSGIERVPEIFGSNHDDVITTAPLTASYDFTKVYGAAGDDTLTGTESQETLIGGSGADRLSGGGGNDLLKSEGDADGNTFGMDEGSARDWVSGGAGDDYLICGAGDTIMGGSGFDSLALDLRGRGGAVTFEVRQLSTQAGIALFGATIAQVEWLSYLYLPDAPAGTVNTVSLSPRKSQYGETGVTIGGTGSDHIAGSSANDSISGGGGRDEIRGNRGQDSIQGDGGADRLHGGLGDDTIGGGDGDDWIAGDAGTDTINGGAGNDTLLVSGEGVDTLFGDAGVDTVAFAHGAQGVFVNLAAGAALRGDTRLASLAGIENVTGTAADDQLLGSDLANRLVGGAGNDTISGRDGRDLLVGGAGDDALNGGADRDMLSGGAGADQFHLDAIADSASAADRITDFEHGTDRLAFSAAAFSSLAASADGSLEAGQFALGKVARSPMQHLLYDSERGILRYDADGDGLGAAMVVAILGHAPPLTAGDILLV